MKPFSLPCLFALLLFFNSCSPGKEDKPDCSLVDCMSVSANFAIKFIDKNSGEDMLANGSLDTTGIIVKNGRDEQLYITKNALNIDSLGTALIVSDNSRMGNNKIKIITKQGLITFSYNYFSVKSGCCGISAVSGVRVDGYLFQINSIGNLPENFNVLRIEI